MITLLPCLHEPNGRILVMTLEQANMSIHSGKPEYMPSNDHFPTFLMIRLTIADARVRFHIYEGLEWRANGEGANHRL